MHAMACAHQWGMPIKATLRSSRTFCSLRLMRCTQDGLDSTAGGTEDQDKGIKTTSCDAIFNEEHRPSAYPEGRPPPSFAQECDGNWPACHHCVGIGVCLPESVRPHTVLVSPLSTLGLTSRLLTTSLPSLLAFLLPPSASSFLPLPRLTSPPRPTAALLGGRARLVGLGTAKRTEVFRK